MPCVFGSDRRPSWWLGSCVAVEMLEEDDDEQTMPVCAIISDQQLRQLFNGQAGRDPEQAQQVWCSSLSIDFWDCYADLDRRRLE